MEPLLLIVLIVLGALALGVFVDATVDGSFVVLFDRWPGVAPPLNPADMPAALTTPVVAAAYRLGEKFSVWNPLTTGTLGLNGWTTFVYLRLATQGTTIAAGDVCVPCSATNIYLVSNDQAGTTSALDIEGSPLAATALSAITDDYYAWFWCGGVCPQFHAPGVNADLITDGDVAIGIVGAGSAGTASNETVLCLIADNVTAPIGYSLSADS